MKPVRALIAAVVTIAAAVAIQMATSSGASALVPHHDACGFCWTIIHE